MINSNTCSWAHVYQGHKGPLPLTDHWGMKTQSPILSVISLSPVIGFSTFGDCVPSSLRHVTIARTGIKPFICICLMVPSSACWYKFPYIFPFFLTLLCFHLILIHSNGQHPISLLPLPWTAWCLPSRWSVVRQSEWGWHADSMDHKPGTELGAGVQLPDCAPPPPTSEAGIPPPHRWTHIGLSGIKSLPMGSSSLQEVSSPCHYLGRARPSILPGPQH